MAVNDRFQISASAALFAGGARVDWRPENPLGFRRITARPAARALGDLAAALSAGDGFCVTQEPLPKDCQTKPAHFLTLTGGSTGAPKVIRRTATSWRESFAVNAARFKLAQHQSVAVLGCLSHSLALYGVLEGLDQGLDILALAGVPPTRQRSLLQDHKTGVLYATPTQLRLLLSGKPGRLDHIATILCGGGALDPQTAQLVQAHCPNAQLHQFYGAAETSFVTMTDAQTPEGSVGKAYPGVELSLRDGVLWVSSPYLFDGYACGASDQTLWQDGFVTVGELATIDADGNVWITGRQSRQVNIADHLVSPETVERLVAAHPLGGPCAAVPVADPVRDTRLALVLQGSPDAARAQTLRAVCQGQLGARVAPRVVLFCPELPRLASGKPDLTAIAKWVEAQP